MARRARLDVELVRRGLVSSREQAARVIEEGRVLVGGQRASKPATAVDAATSLVLTQADGPRFASRGGAKLAGALAAFAATAPPLRISGRRCLDAGASTGGFTDVLLRAGAAAVVAVDVGYGQLAWPLRTDPRVQVLDRTNARSLSPADVDEPVDVVVADLSFISLTLVLPALRSVATDTADFLLLVKPQFEAGREHVERGGVVRDVDARASAVRRVAAAARTDGLGVRGVVASELPGPAGNVEYFLWLHADAPALADDLLERAIADGPA
jgi:23S rRNA (cytidine1920-2'-O)/16S rRNA (cytidine1409-2'-O)-methyltransferase